MAGFELVRARNADGTYRADGKPFGYVDPLPEPEPEEEQEPEA
jgi:hypothetical protein